MVITTVAVIGISFGANSLGVFDAGDSGAGTNEVTASNPTSPAAPTFGGLRTASLSLPASSLSPSGSASPGSGVVSIVSVTSPVSLGATASVTARADPGAVCSITYTHPSGKTSTASGLDPKAAGSDGTVTWNWLISNGTKPVGNGGVDVTCDGYAAHATIVIH